MCLKKGNIWVTGQLSAYNSLDMLQANMFIIYTLHLKAFIEVLVFSFLKLSVLRLCLSDLLNTDNFSVGKKSKRKAQGVPQSIVENY